jgi:hypothetical protein
VYQWSVKCNYESCVNMVNKFKIQYKTPSIVTPKFWQYNSQISVCPRILPSLSQMPYHGKIWQRQKMFLLEIQFSEKLMLLLHAKVWDKVSFFHHTLAHKQSNVTMLTVSICTDIRLEAESFIINNLQIFYNSHSNEMCLCRRLCNDVFSFLFQDNLAVFR